MKKHYETHVEDTDKLFSDSDKRTAENFGIDYLDVNEFVNLYNKKK